MPPPAVVATGVTKHYPAARALDGVDLVVEPREIVALLGPNGAGKTTFVEILEGYRDRTGGEVTVLGVDPQAGDARWRARLGIVLQSSGMFEQLTVEELVGHFAGFYPDPLAVGQVIELVGLAEKRRSTVGKLSGGQRRRVDVALGIVGNPQLIFLDEPTTGFDPAARRQAWEVVSGLADLGKTILLTTHYLDEAERLAGRAAVIIGGRIVAEGPPAQLGGRDTAAARIVFRCEGALTGVQPPFGSPGGRDDGTWTIETATPTQDLARLTGWARDAGAAEIPGLSVQRPSLEDVYLAMVAGHEATSPEVPSA